MGFAENYFSKQGNFQPHLPEPPSERLHYIVVIPAYCETNLSAPLNALWHCTRPLRDVEVIIVVNYPENAGASIIQASLNSVKEVRQWISAHHDPAFRVMLIEALNLPAKHAGAGLARKAGMDEAAYRFNRISNAGGLIISFDADCTCDQNYFQAIESCSEKFPLANGFNIYFEHPVSGNEYPERIYKGIIRYELHLRYVNQFLRFANFPHAFHTIGSAFAVRAGTYALQGGMNRRKAGEDFYFLHKIILLGNFHEINTTRVIPSPRPSVRIPFGTGTAITRFVSAPDDDFMTYHPDSFLLLKDFFQSAGEFYRKTTPDTVRSVENTPEPLKSFLKEKHLENAISEINSNSSNMRSFTNRFFRWFDAFRIVKYLNHAHRNHYTYMNIREASEILLHHISINTPQKTGESELLNIMREIEKLSQHC
ncbi:MAG: glycosyltransferase family 2 protein [Bacteroidales bacterium]|nr:glycosyltransferase family 2 protein [Bacteroidales bacterium]